MIPAESIPDAGARGFEHAAGRAWDAMRDLFAAYVVDSPDLPADERESFLSVPAWTDLHECPSATFIEALFGPWAKVVTEPMLDLAQHSRERHGGDS